MNIFQSIITFPEIFLNNLQTIATYPEMVRRTIQSFAKQELALLHSLLSSHQNSQVVVLFQYHDRSSHTLNDSLLMLSDEDRFQETVRLYTLWVESLTHLESDHCREARKTYGSFFDVHHEARLHAQETMPLFEFLTVTSNGAALRTWYQRPSCMLRRCELQQRSICRCPGLFLGVYGNPKIVHRYLDMMLSLSSFPRTVKIQEDCFYFCDT